MYDGLYIYKKEHSFKNVPPQKKLKKLNKKKKNKPWNFTPGFKKVPDKSCFYRRVSLH